MAAKLRNVSFSEENNREFATYTPEVGGETFNIMTWRTNPIVEKLCLLEKLLKKKITVCQSFL